MPAFKPSDDIDEIPDDQTIDEIPEAKAAAPSEIDEVPDDSIDEVPEAPAPQRIEAPAPGAALEEARQLIREKRDRDRAEMLVRQHFEQQMAAKEEQKRNDPRNWSSTRFKKEMPKPQTPQDQAFYDATLADIKSREKGLFDKVMTEVFGRPAAAHREAIRSAIKPNENMGEGYVRGATKPEESQTFQDQFSTAAIQNSNKMVDELEKKLGVELGNEDFEVAVRVMAGMQPAVAASVGGMIADGVVSPADWLVTILGAKALPYLARIPAGARTLGERATRPIQEILSNTPVPKAPAPVPAVPVDSPDLPASVREGVRIEVPQAPAPDQPLVPAAATPAQPAPAAPGSALKEAAEGLYQKTFNRLQSLENLSKEAKAAGHQLLPGDDPGLRSRGYLGIQPKVQSVLEDKTFRITPEGQIETTGEGLKPILKDFDGALPQVEKAAKERDLVEYLKARRVVEDLQRARPDDPTAAIATPQQTALAKHTLAELQARYGEGFKVLENTATRLYDYQKRVLHSLVEAGNLSEEGYQAIIQKNPNYVPFDRVMDDIDFEGVVPRNKGRFSGANAPVKTIKGSEREIHDPIESIIKNTYRVLDSAERNSVARSVVKLADVLPGKIQLIDHADPKAIRYYENGQPLYMRASENITDAMKGLNEASANMLVKILSMPANWLRQGATLTPEFMTRNPIRDQFTALIQTKVGYKPVIDSAGAIADIIGRKEIYYDWLRSGGAHSTITELSRENLRKSLAHLRGNRNLLSKLNIITHAQDLSQLLEQATRLGVYKAAGKKGFSPIEAGFQSREASVDFARIGSSIKDVNRISAFFNAGLQGLDKTFRTAAADPVGLAMKGTSLITIPSVALYLVNRNDPDYKELPRWQKNLFWMFKWPGTDTYVRIPKPFLYGQVFGSAPEAFLEYAETKDPRAIDSLKKSLLDSLSPVSGEPEAVLLPTAIKPIIENFSNRSFFTGRAIVPESKTRLRPSEQYTRSTHEVSKEVGKATNVSPAMFENWVNGYFGGLGRYALDIGDKIIDETNRITGKPVEPNRPTEVTDIPLVKGFTSRTHITSPESVNEFYEHRKAAEMDYLTAKQLYEKGDKAGAEKVVKDGNAQFYKLTQQAGDAISKLNTYAEELVSSKKYDEATLKKKLKEVDEKQLEIARRVNKIVAAKRKGQ